MKTTCKCEHCETHRMGERMRKESLQQEFEATCFMYEMIESALKQAVNKYNAGMSLTHTQKQILAKAIWRN